MLSPQSPAMPSQHFTSRNSNRYDLSSFAAGTPGLQLPINDAAEVAQHLDQLKGVLKPLVAYEELASRAEARQGSGGAAAAAGAGSVRHTDLNPVPNPRYYRVHPPQDLEERIRAAKANTFTGVNVLGELRAHQNGTPPSAPPAHQNGVPSRVRSPGTPRPMVFGHRPVLKGPMPSQAAIFTDDEDENDQNGPPASGLQHVRTHTPGKPRPMDSGGSSSAYPQTHSPCVRTPGTPRPMVFGTRPVFCGRMPSQAVMVESDHEDDDSDATLRCGALEDFAANFEDSLRGGSLSSAHFEFEDEDEDEILAAVHEFAESSGHHTDAHEISLATNGEHAESGDGARSEFSSGVSNDQPVSQDQARWVWVEWVGRGSSTNETFEMAWVDRHILPRKYSISDGMAREYQLLNDDVVSEDEEMAYVCSIYSYSYSAEAEHDRTGAVTAEQAFQVRREHGKALKTGTWKKVWKLARSKVGYRDRKARRVRRLVKMRMGKQVAEIFVVDGALAVETGEGYRSFSSKEEVMGCHLQPLSIPKPAQRATDRTEWMRGGWLPFTAENNAPRSLSKGQLTWEEELSIPFKHSQHSDTRHWQCQSYTSACTKCRAKPATQEVDSYPELTMEDLDLLSRKHMWRFEIHRALQAVKEALIHTAVDEFLDAYETEQKALLPDGTEVEQKAFTSEVETTMRGGYLLGLGDEEDENDGIDVAPVPVPMKAKLRAFKVIEEAMMITPHGDFKAMLHCPVYPVRGDVWEKFGLGKKRKMGSLERLMMAWDMLDRKSFEGMEEAMIRRAVLDGRAKKLAEMARRFREGLRGGVMEGFDDTDMREFGDEEVVVEHREYAASSCRIFGGHDTTHDSSSGHESSSALSRAGSENSSETSQDTSVISSQLSKEVPLSDHNKRELAEDAWCLFAAGGFRADSVMDETETRNRLHGILSSFRKASNELPDGTDFPTPTICACALQRSLHKGMWAAAERLWNMGEVEGELGWTREEVAEASVKSRDWGFQDLKVVTEARKISEFATSTSARGFLRANTGVIDIRKMASIPTCIHRKTKRKLEPLAPSLRTSTSLRDDGLTQLPLEQNLSPPKFPWEPSNLSSETSLRGGARRFQGLETDLPYPEFPWEPSNLASVPPLRGGGNALSEVSEAAHDIAYALAGPCELLELVHRAEGFDPYAGDRFHGPEEIRDSEKHNRRARARAVAWRKRRGVQLRQNRFRWPTPTHHDPDFVYKWKDRKDVDVACNWDHPRETWDRRNRWKRGTMKADKRDGRWFGDGRGMRYAQGNYRQPSQKLVKRSKWTWGARRRGGIFGEELAGSLSGLKGEEFAKSGVCGGEGELPSGVSGGLRGGQLTNTEEKDQMEGLECHGAQTTDDQESQTKALESHDDAREYQIQCSGQDAATTSPSNDTTKLTPNASSHLPTPSSLSFLNQAFVPSPSPTVASLYQASLSHRKGTGLVRTRTWLALNNHHKKCRPGMCGNPCRAIVTLPFKPPQIKPVSRLDSINAIAYWFGEEAEASCKPYSGGLRGGFLKDEKEEGKEDGQEVDWRSPNSLRDREPDPLAHLLMRRQRFSHRRAEVAMEEIHGDLSGHNYDCQPGRCSSFCRAGVALPVPDVKTETREILDDALSAYLHNVSPTQDDPTQAGYVSNVHRYSQRIAELNRTLGLTVRTDFAHGYCVEGHTHPEGMDVSTESDASRESFRRLKGERHEEAPARQMPPLLFPLLIRQKPHWCVGEFSRPVMKGKISPPTTPEVGSLRGGDLDDAFKMPRTGVNGWLFDRSTNWTFHRARVISKEDQSKTQGTDTDFRAGYQELQLPDSPPLTPVVGQEAEMLSTVFEKLSFVPPLQPFPPHSRNASVSLKSGPISLGYTRNGKFDPYLCWPEWAYKLYDPPHSSYDSPACDTTGRWRRPVSRHLLAGILDTLPERTGMFRRLGDGVIERVEYGQMTWEERGRYFEYERRRKRRVPPTPEEFPWMSAETMAALLKRNWKSGVLDYRSLRADAKAAEVKAGLRGGAMKFPPSGPLAVHFDGDIRWPFRCCGCRPMTPDSPVLETIPSEAITVCESDTDSRQSEDAIIISPTQTSFIDEQRSRWYSRPVDANKLKDRLRGLLHPEPKSKLFKEKHGNMVSIEFPAAWSQSLQSRRLKPSEVLMSKIDSYKTRALKSKHAGIWALRCDGLRGGGLASDDDVDEEMDYPSPPKSDDEGEEVGYVSVAPSSPSKSDNGEEWEKAWEDPEDDVLDEQEMDYELSVDLLPLEDAYAEFRERLREEHRQAMEMINCSGRENGKKRKLKHCAKLRPSEYKTPTSTIRGVEDDSESESNEDLDYDPDVENAAPIVQDADSSAISSDIVDIYDPDMEDFPSLPCSCGDLPDPSSDDNNHSSPTYSPEVSTRATSVSSAGFPSKGMWVMVHPRVTQLLVAGTYRHKSKHLGKKSGLMRLHDDWADRTPSSMRLMSSSSAFRNELQEERKWERLERERSRNIKKLQGILADLDRSVAEAESDDEDGDEKDDAKVLVEVSSDSEDHTQTISFTHDPDKEKEKKDSETILHITETVWNSPTIQLIGLSRPEHHVVPGESERSLEKKVKRLVADDEDVRLEADERRRQKLVRMVSVMERAQALSTNSIQGRGLRGGLGYVVDGELETLSDLSGTTMREVEEEEGEEEQ